MSGKRVVEMSHIDGGRTRERLQMLERAAAPHGIPGSSGRSTANAVVAVFMTQHRVAVLLQQRGFTREYAVLAAGWR